MEKKQKNAVGGLFFWDQNQIEGGAALIGSRIMPGKERL